ncbi:MAG: PilZ domain-containing protein [Planctomycetota bacterium]|jgi:hypothetical protein
MSQGAPNATDRIIDAAESLQAGDAMLPEEKRQQKRYEYSALVALLLRGPDGTRSRPIVVRGSDLSSGGLCVLSSIPLAVGGRGVMQIVRSNGQFALVGFQVRHCRPLGNADYCAGLQFCSLPEGFTREEFLDAQGNLLLLDPLLRHNCG